MDQKTTQSGPLRELFDSYKAGKINRRSFAQGAAALGLSAPVVAFLGNQGAAAQDATPEATAVSEVLTRPEVGTENQTRGEGGDLNIIQWQAPTHLSPHNGTGVKDILGGVVVVEPLIHYLTDASMIPNLITEVPSQEAGTLAEDMTSVTLTLLEGLLWSDGEPVTTDDIAFTIDWVKNPDNTSVNIGVFEPISDYEIVDDLTIKVNFKESNPFWFAPFTGTSTGFLYPKHALEGGADANQAFLSKPIGTGPYVVESFTPNDQVVYVANENYREPNKPFFQRVLVKGGGDAAGAARAILQTGESDFAWNLQVEPDVLDGMQGDDNVGVLMPYPGVAVERINFNFSDPNTEVDGQRSEMNTPHPFLTDQAVRDAIAMAVDRETIANNFYGNGQPAATNILNGDPRTDSPNTERVFDPEAAKAKLEEAGWVMEGDVRKKDDVELNVVFATSVNPVRQKTQAVVKANLEAIGIKVQLEQVDAGIYFAGDNEQDINHFYWDMNMYQSIPSSPRPLSFFETWVTETIEGGETNIAQASNNWQGQNFARYQNPEFDEVWRAAGTETDPEALADLFIEMNDIVIVNNVILPLVVVGSPRGASKRLRAENIHLAAYSYDYWNIANWNLAE